MRRLVLCLLLTACGASPADLAQSRQFVADNRGKFLPVIACPTVTAAPLGWASLDDAGKRNATLTLAVYCEGETGQRAVRVVHRDTGALLAEHDGTRVTLH